MPRAGSTLLMNILAQNPEFHSTATSGILDVLFGVRNQWDTLVEFKAMKPEESEAGKRRVLGGILESYYSNTTQPVIFDKSRGWLAYIELAEAILQRKVRILVPVRDLRDVLASFEKLFRKTPTHQQAQESSDYFLWQTTEGRCEIWCRANQPVGIAYNRIKDALRRGLADRLCFVDYQVLTTAPGETMRKIYDFLELPLFKHSFDAVEQVTWENDAIHQIPGLHDIRPKIEPQAPQWPGILGEELGKKYGGATIW